MDWPKDPVELIGTNQPNLPERVRLLVEEVVKDFDDEEAMDHLLEEVSDLLEDEGGHGFFIEEVEVA